MRANPQDLGLFSRRAGPLGAAFAEGSPGSPRLPPAGPGGAEGHAAGVVRRLRWGALHARNCGTRATSAKLEPENGSSFPCPPIRATSRHDTDSLKKKKKIAPTLIHVLVFSATLHFHREPCKPATWPRAPSWLGADSDGISPRLPSEPFPPSSSERSLLLLRVPGLLTLRLAPCPLRKMLIPWRRPQLRARGRASRRPLSACGSRTR